MKATSSLTFALLAATATAFTPTPPTPPEGEPVPTIGALKPADYVEPDFDSPDSNFTTPDFQARQHCTLVIRWTGNWIEIGRRYSVDAHAIPDGGTYWNSWAMAESWANKCRSGSDVWANNPKAWQHESDPAWATCDVSFPDGSDGHNKYLWWHRQAWESWARDHPGCIVDVQV